VKRRSTLSRAQNQELLENCLSWKAEELKVQAGALIQRATDHERKAAEYREFKSWVGMGPQSNRACLSSRLSYTIEMIDTVHAEELAATKLREQAQDEEP